MKHTHPSSSQLLCVSCTTLASLARFTLNPHCRISYALMFCFSRFTVVGNMNRNNYDAPYSASTLTSRREETGAFSSACGIR